MVAAKPLPSVFTHRSFPCIFGSAFNFVLSVDLFTGKARLVSPTRQTKSQNVYTKFPGDGCIPIYTLYCLLLFTYNVRAIIIGN
ncbi:hypothetical protein V1523DRAFT_55212 [Lipomyces doorenjongii]